MKIKTRLCELFSSKKLLKIENYILVYVDYIHVHKTKERDETGTLILRHSGL